MEKINQKITFIVCQAQIDNGRHTKQSKRIIKQAKSKKKRPDITHQCLLTLMDSPLNKAGFMKIYIHTDTNVLIEINSNCKIPRSLSRFTGLMNQLLKELRIKASNGETLMKIVKSPVINHLIPDTARIELCQKGEKISKENILSFSNRGLAFFVNAIASGDDGTCEWAEAQMKVSDFGLSAAVCCGKICNLLEDVLDVF